MGQKIEKKTGADSEPDDAPSQANSFREMPLPHPQFLRYPSLLSRNIHRESNSEPLLIQPDALQTGPALDLTPTENKKKSRYIFTLVQNNPCCL